MTSKEIELVEHDPTLLTSNSLSRAQGQTLLDLYSPYIDVDFPTPKTGERWRLVSRGCVGAFAVDAEMIIVVKPKVAVGNIALMLRYAYDLPIDDFRGLVSCKTLPELYNQLARMLAREVQRLIAHGVYQSYETTTEALSAIRGRIDMVALIRSEPRARVRCRYSQRTADVIENQILLSTAERVLRSGLCSEDVQRELRESYRRLLATASPRPITLRDLSIQYNRLSERYKPAHALCRLFLEAAGPIAERGAVTAVPFLLDMPLLFERFVARWLAAHLPSNLRLVTQEHFAVGDEKQLDYFIDMVIYDDVAGRALCVLDTKYKASDLPSADDVSQVSFYALLKSCGLAGLVYPSPVTRSWQGRPGGVRAFRTAFDLSRDLEATGAEFLSDLEGRFASAH